MGELERHLRELQKAGGHDLSKPLPQLLLTYIIFCLI